MNLNLFAGLGNVGELAASVIERFEANETAYRDLWDKLVKIEQDMQRFNDALQALHNPNNTV